MQNSETSHKINVNLKNRSYSINIGSNYRKNLFKHLNPFFGSSKVLILSDENIKKLYPQLFKKKKDVFFYFIKPGEKSKNFNTIKNITTYMAQNKMDRTSCLAALGGGVVGDLGGFAASIYMRGINYIQIPTTLLSQIDSSVGGKTGINNDVGKNMIGTFYQPKAVFIDTGFLDTLPKQEFINGFAEVIKHGIIKSKKLFVYLENNLDNIFALKKDVINNIVASNCKIKASVVSKDEKEKGLRAILNFGHTYGHAIENLTGYTKYSHGQAVMLGIHAACITALHLKLIGEKECARIIYFLKKSNLPKKVKADPLDLYNKMFSDKKTKKGKLNFILPNAIGKVSIVNSPPKNSILKGIKSIIRS